MIRIILVAVASLAAVMAQPHAASAQDAKITRECVSGDCVNGSGQAKYFSDGALSVIWTGAFENGVPEGRGLMEEIDGATFEGTVSRGQPLDGKMIYSDGDTYVGTFKDGLFDGQGVYTFGPGDYAGDTFVGVFAVGLSEGRAPDDAAERAAVAASLACRKLGAQSAMPTTAEVERALAELKP